MFFLSVRRKRQSGGSDERVINPNEEGKKKGSQQMGRRLLQILQFVPRRGVAAMPLQQSIVSEC